MKISDLEVPGLVTAGGKEETSALHLTYATRSPNTEAIQLLFGSMELIFYLYHQEYSSLPQASASYERPVSESDHLTFDDFIWQKLIAKCTYVEN